MKKKALRKDFYIEIMKTKGRFISIFFIVALGVAFYTGIRSTQPDMKLSADQIYDSNNLMDIRVLSTLGLTEDDVNTLSNVDGVNKVKGAYSADMLVIEEDSQLVVKVLSYPNSINKVDIKEGRSPKSSKECLVDPAFLLNTGHKIGDKISMKSGTHEDISDTLKYDEYTIVGSGITPYYLSRDKGTSSIGSGNINSFIMVLDDAFSLEAYTEIYLTVDGGKDFISYSKDYDDSIDEVIDRIKVEAKDQRIDARYNEIVDKANKELDSSKKDLEDAKITADKKLTDAKKKLENAQIKLENGRKEIKSNDKKIKDGWTKWHASKKKLEDGRKQLENGKLQLDASSMKLANGKLEYEKGLKEYEVAMKYLQEGKAQIEQATSQINNIQNPEEKSMMLAALEQQKTELAKAEATLTRTKAFLDKTNKQLYQGEKTLQVQQKKYNSSLKEIVDGENQLKASKKELQHGEEELSNAKKELKDGEEELKNGQEKYLNSKNEAEQKINDGEKEISDAESDIAKIKRPKWYVLSRNSIQTYVEYGQDADRIGAIGKVFPAIFFLVAALVSLTTMTRMVEEQRTQIGTLKALGYSKISIASKYIVYALLATLGGSFFGAVVGSLVLPYIIISAYQIMYENLNVIVTPLIGQNFILATLIAVTCVVLATFLACYKELASSPATLMRPATPKLGKRVLLERLPFIWKHLNFTGKSTIRNLIRYKKRFFMTVLGIGGCMSLLLVGFGLKDSIFSIVGIQYNEIHIYDGVVSLDTDKKLEDLDKAKNYLDNHELVKDSAYVQENAIKAEGNDITKDAYLTVMEDTSSLPDYFVFRDRISKTRYTLDDDSVVITEKLAKLLNIEVGDTIQLKNGDFDTVEVNVGAISENYVMHYIFMSPTLYEQLYNEVPQYNEILYLAPEITSDMEESFTQDILTQDGVVSNLFTSNISNEFGDSLENLDVVIFVLILAAGGLAFVVLYNLNNINISERRRELATLKVLGFYDVEVSEYVFRENVLLTIIGTITGVALGFLLHRYVITTVEIDMIMFGRNIYFISYIKSILLTFLFSMLINFSMHFKLKKIDMATSLKSVE